MNTGLKRLVLTAVWVSIMTAGAHAHASEASAGMLRHQPAARLVAPESAMLLGASRAGSRLIAVGDRGTVLLSDDGGKTYRQAREVPTRATLTAVTFVDALDGWAVGHWGVVLRTSDGGETWTLQRDDTGVDQPLFSVWFENGRTGYATGLWSLLLMTNDGGATWTSVELPPPQGSSWADRNLFTLFSNRTGDLFIAAEQGLVYKLAHGESDWRAIETGNRGTFWTGAALRSGVLLVAGLQGKVYRSTDSGESWAATVTPTTSSITAMREMADDSVVAIGLDGLVMRSHDDGVTFHLVERREQMAFTAILDSGGGLASLFSMDGVAEPLSLGR